MLLVQRLLVTSITFSTEPLRACLLLQKYGDYEAFERVLRRRCNHIRPGCSPIACCRSHWHFVVGPQQEGELTAFAQWLTHTPTMRWHTHYHTLGTGHVYQGRCKSFQVQEDEHFYQVVRHVERNALRANLVQRAEDWRCPAYGDGSALTPSLLSRWRIGRGPCRRIGSKSLIGRRSQANGKPCVVP